jgi:hypothetical protein
MRCDLQGALAPRSILREHLLGRGMYRHQTRFAELGAANRQHTFLEIDILDSESDRLTNPQAGHTEQPEQTVIGPRAQAPAGRKLQGAFEQARDVLVRVQVGSRSARDGSRPGGGTPVCGSSRMMAGEATHIAQTLCPCRRLSRGAVLCPFQGELCGNVHRSAGLHECVKLGQANASIAQFESQAAPQGQIVLNRLSWRFTHLRPGKANGRNQSKSTFA